MVQQRLGNVPGRLPQGLGGRQGEGGGKIPVGRVPGNLHRGGMDLRLGQRPVRRRGAIGGHGQFGSLVLGILYHVCHWKTLFLTGIFRALHTLCNFETVY